MSTGRLVSMSASTPEPSGLVVRLREGQDQPAPVEAIPTAASQPLSAEQVRQVLNRLPALEPAPGDVQDFALPSQSLPPPRPGTTIEEEFPPPAAKPTPDPAEAGPLQVLRYSPEGDVPLAPYLSVTFSQPMVPLTGLADLAAADVPVRLSPQPPGKWRWIGTKTLAFEPEAEAGAGSGRFPMATRFSAEIPAGTTSATGGKLAEALSWSFTTPPPNATAWHPVAGPTTLDPLVFVAFDQKINPAAVLETIRLTAGEVRASLRLATAEELAGDEQVARMAREAVAGRWLAVRAKEPLPPAARVTVEVGPGTPSAEGPLTTSTAHRFSFDTYGPLQVVESNCGWDRCVPYSPWSIRFSNPLDDAAYEEAWVQVTPALPGMSLQIWGDTLQIQGRSSGRTTYKVRLAAAIQDRFGQTLGQEQEVSFAVGSSDPVFWGPEGNFVTLDPSAGKPVLSVYSINFDKLEVNAYTVRPADWQDFRRYMQEYYRSEKPPQPPGKLAISKTLNVESQPDAMVETVIDLSEALPSGLGHAIVVVQPVTARRADRPRPVQAWVQSTRIGLDAFADGQQMLAWANALADGAPLAGVSLALLPGDRSATTGADGSASIPLPSGRAGLALVAQQGSDSALLPSNTYWWSEEGWRAQPLADSARWYVFDDRGLYRPGETVHLKGWIRQIEAGPRGDVAALPGAGQVRYSLVDSQGNPIRDGEARLNAFGGFDMAIELPETMNLGPAYLELGASGNVGAAGGSQTVHTINVQEFRRPEFEVTATASEGPHFVGGSADLKVAATYYAGGGLPDAEVTWQVTTQSGSYSPPGWDDFTFGRWVPWWERWGWEGGEERGPAGEVFTGKTDAAGVHRLRLDFESVDPPEPTAVTAEATVMDVNRQAWTGRANLLVHPAELYVGMRTDRLFVEREEPIGVDLIVTDLDGAAAAGREITATAVRLAWRYRNGEWQEEETGEQRCVVVSADQPVRCTFETPEGGTYRIRATVTDAQGRLNRTEITRWVSGGERPPSRQVEQESVTLIPDKKDYQPGETAEILVQSPFYPAEGLLTLRRSGLVSRERFSMSGPTHILRVPIEESYIPNVHVQVDVVGAAERTADAAGGTPGPELPKRPAFAMGELDLTVPPLARTLALTVEPQATRLEPGGETTVDVTVLDAAGKAVAGAEIAAVVVDESVLALTGYDLADPLAVFYAPRSPDVGDTHSRASIVLANPDQLGRDVQVEETLVVEKEVERAAAPAAMPMATEAPAAAQSAGYAASDAAAAAPIAVRSDFNPLAAFAPSVVTDDSGRGRVTVKLPDNLTRYRVMVVAVSGGKQFGKGESAITARLPLMARPSPPRFLNFGDAFELPVVVQNQTDLEMQVEVAVAAANAALTEGAGRRVTVPANDRVEIRFPAATVRAGTARFQVAAVSGKWADAAQFELPVWTPATTEAFATYGVLDEGAMAQPVIAPTGVFTQFGGLEITTSSTALQALTDAVLYLTSYPFDCSEQLASRILAVAALRDVLSAFQAAGLPDSSEIEAAVTRDVERLRGMQNDDGGFPLWRRGLESWPYHSIHAAHALQKARQKGYDVPAEMLDRAVAYLRQIEGHYPSWYGEDTRRTLTAYALYVRKLAGDADPKRARALMAEAGLEELSPEAIGWVLAVLSDDSGSASEVAAIRRHLLNRVTETAGAAHFVTDYGDQGYVLLSSDRRSDGVLLDALIGDQPDSDLIPKIVKGLLAHRTAGRWANTQENAFILLALDRYFNTYEAQTPDFVARVWLGEQYAGEAAFRGRTTDYRQINIPMAYLAEDAAQRDVLISKEGPGRLYYRLGLRYAPADLTLPPYDAGFTVQRLYEAVDDPSDVRRDATGVWHIKAGARVRVRLTMVAPTRRYHVALVDPLPAGLEVLNPALAVTGSLPQDPSGQGRSSYWWWWGPWYEHQNLRDERVEAFASLVWEGVHSYSYVARATTPGRFVVPPVKAEEMYAPETFGRSAVDWVVVE